MIKFIYKICSLSEWSNFQKKGKFCGSKKDLSDGYIHFSKKNQVKTTLKKYFSKKNNLVLLKIKVSKLQDLKWEKSRESKLFPHLYSFLSLKDVRSAHKIYLKKNGLHTVSF